MRSPVRSARRTRLTAMPEQATGAADHDLTFRFQERGARSKRFQGSAARAAVRVQREQPSIELPHQAAHIHEVGDGNHDNAAPTAMSECEGWHPSATFRTKATSNRTHEAVFGAETVGSV